MSDIVNFQKAQGAIANDWHVFGVSTDTGAAVATLGPGVIISGPSSMNDGLAGLVGFFQVGLSKGVELLSNTDALGGSFVMLAKHEMGNRIYGSDSDSPSTLYQESSPGLTLTASGLNLTSVQSHSDFVIADGWTGL